MKQSEDDSVELVIFPYINQQQHKLSKAAIEWMANHTKSTEVEYHDDGAHVFYVSDGTVPPVETPKQPFRPIRLPEYREYSQIEEGQMDGDSQE